MVCLTTKNKTIIWQIITHCSEEGHTAEGWQLCCLTNKGKYRGKYRVIRGSLTEAKQDCVKESISCLGCRVDPGSCLLGNHKIEGDSGMSYPEIPVWNPACGMWIEAVLYVPVTEVFQARVGIIILKRYNFEEQSLIVYNFRGQDFSMNERTAVIIQIRGLLWLQLIEQVLGRQFSN